MVPWGKRDKATGEMGRRESFPGRGRACTKVQKAGIEGCLSSWLTASWQEEQEETRGRRGPQGPDHKVFWQLHEEIWVLLSGHLRSIREHNWVAVPLMRQWAHCDQQRGGAGGGL